MENTDNTPKRSYDINQVSAESLVEQRIPNVYTDYTDLMTAISFDLLM